MSRNFFVRLKSYQTVKINQKENHATEVLAGCLNLSLTLRASFLNLIGEKLEDVKDAEAWVVRTQIEAGENSRWDLVLERVNPIRLIVVESKVGDTLDADQVCKYRNLLNPMAGRLVALVQAERMVPAKKIYPDLRVIRWQQVAAAFNTATASSSAAQSTDSLLASQFSEYLNIEQITMTSCPDDLLGFEKGLCANRALESLFAEVNERVSKLPEIGNGLKEIHRQGSFDRLRWSDSAFYVELHFRVNGLESWEGGHTLALGAGTFAPPAGVPQSKALQSVLKDLGWQIWMPSPGGQIWSVAVPGQESERIYAYRPLVGENIPNDKHLKPLKFWPDMTWENLNEFATSEFQQAVVYVRSLIIGQ